MKMISLVFGMGIAIFLLIALDPVPTYKTAEYLNAESISAGVVVHGCNSSGWIKNENDFPVRIKNISWITTNEVGWIKVFQPNEISHQLLVGRQHGFHIYTLEGVEIGWVRPIPNGKKEQT